MHYHSYSTAAILYSSLDSQNFDLAIGSLTLMWIRTKHLHFHAYSSIGKFILRVGTLLTFIINTAIVHYVDHAWHGHLNHIQTRKL